MGCHDTYDYVEGCALYSEPGVCLACAEGFVINTNGVCNAATPTVIAGCRFYNSDGTCQVCVDILNDPTTNCAAFAVADCLFNDPFGNCDRCNAPFRVDTSTDPHTCINSPADDCLIVAEGGSCICLLAATAPANCACSIDSICTACEDGYTLSGNECIENIMEV